MGHLAGRRSVGSLAGGPEGVALVRRTTLLPHAFGWTSSERRGHPTAPPPLPGDLEHANLGALGPAVRNRHIETTRRRREERGARPRRRFDAGDSLEWPLPRCGEDVDESAATNGDELLARGVEEEVV